jgi:hypothetical protein
MSGFFAQIRRRYGLAVLSVGAAVLASASPAGAAAPPTGYTVGPQTTISAACPGQNAESEGAVDARLGYAYQVWIGCKGIGYARSVDGGASYGAAVNLPGTGGKDKTWDPAITVGPDGSVYAAFMITRGGQTFPVVDVSRDHGATFQLVANVIPPDPKNWGDREFIAVAPDGTLYLTWDYGPSAAAVTFICAANGSCSFATGDVNAVLQKSTDGGRTWSAMSYISPGFPNSGADSAPLLVEPNGDIDVLYQGYDVTNPPVDDLGVAYSYFTKSTDRGTTWSPPSKVGAGAGSMSAAEWWIDGDLSADAAGDLYATWDTQGANPDGTARDTGWLSYSTDHGRTWSPAIQAPRDTADAPHVIQSVGGPAGIAYVAWLSSSDPSGYALYVRTFSIAHGWLSQPVRVSSGFGSTAVWPGDTFGIAASAPGKLVLSWGSALDGTTSEILATTVTVAVTVAMF